MKTPKEENRISVEQAQSEGYSFDQACKLHYCCKGCYAPGEYLYCVECYKEIMEDEKEV